MMNNYSQMVVTSAIASEILDEFYEKNILQELMCYRKGIEDLYFIYSSYMLERLLLQFENKDKLYNKQAALDEMNQFTLYLIQHKTRYMNSYLQDEMLRLQQNRCSIEYLKKLSSSYRYWIINTNERLQSKIEKINSLLFRKYSFFSELQKKFKLQKEIIMTPEINRFGIFTEQGQISKKGKDSKKEQVESLMIERQVLGSVRWIDTFPQDSILDMIAQIERVQKGAFEQISFNQHGIDHDELIHYSRCPFQAARFLKQYIQKYFGSQEENKKNENISDDNDDNYYQNKKLTYYDKVQFKVSYDRTLLEALISECYTSEHCQQPTLIQGCLNDQAKQICCVEVGKFANVLACGCLDGIIYIYELTKHFLLPGRQNKHKDYENGIKYESNQVYPKMETEKIQEQLNFKVSFQLNQHDGSITALSLIYDEFNLLSASTDQSIKLWCLRTRQLLLIYKGHLSTIWCIKWAPAGYWFATGSQDKTSILWQTDHLQPQKLFVSISSPSPVSLVEFSPSGKYIFTGDELNTLRTWDIDTCSCIAILNLPSQPISISFSLSGIYLAIGCLDGQAHLYFAPIQPMKLISNNIYLEQISQDPYKKLKKYLSKQQLLNFLFRYPVQSISISYDDTILSCQNTHKTAFYSIATLSKPINEDVVQGQYIGQQLEILSKKHPKLTKHSIQAIEILDNQQEHKILYLKMIPQGYCLQLVR